MCASSLRESLRVMEDMRANVSRLKGNEAELALIDAEIIKVRCELARVTASRIARQRIRASAYGLYR